MVHRRPAAVAVLLAAALLASGCLAQDGSARRDPPPLLDGNQAIAGDAHGGEPGCAVSSDGPDGFTLCGVTFRQADGRFTVLKTEGGMAWSDLRLRAGSANLAVVGDEAVDLEGDVDLGRVQDGRVEAGQGITVCRLFEATGPATLTFWDSRATGGTVQQSYEIGACTDEDGVITEAPVRTKVEVVIERDLKVGQQHAQGVSGSTNNVNCVHVPAELAPWSGEATATWTPEAPTANELVLGVAGGDTVRGGSGLNIVLPESGDEAYVGVSPPDPGVTIMQAVHLQLRLVVMSDGSGDPASLIGSTGCNVGF